MFVLVEAITFMYQPRLKNIHHNLNNLKMKYFSMGKNHNLKVFLTHMVESHEMNSLLKLIFSNPNGIFTCYSMYLKDRLL